MNLSIKSSSTRTTPTNENMQPSLGVTGIDKRGPKESNVVVMMDILSKDQVLEKYCGLLSKAQHLESQ